MNTVQLIGNTATDVRVRQTQSGKTVASFKLAVNRPGEDKGADFIWCKTWNGSADACGKYLSKGSRVAVEGSISTSRVEKNGEFTDYVEVNARRVTFLSTRREQEDEQPQGKTLSAGYDEDMPAAVEASTPAPTDDDIPF